MIVEIINTGTELLLGRVLNTHQQWLCARLSEIGYLVLRQVAVPDRGPEIQAAVKEALGRADLVIVTGGLGPTSDDLTRELIATMLGKRLIEDPSVLNHIQEFFVSRKRTMPGSTAVQALVPEGAKVLWNPNGTAPGLAIKVEPNVFKSSAGASWLIMLPGPPRELRPMFDNFVRPLLARELPTSLFVCRTFRTSGVGESMVEELIHEPLQRLMKDGLELGYCARPGQVDLRLAARGASAQELVVAAESIVRPLIASYLYSQDDEELESAVIRAFTQRGETLAVAESCTGGLLAHRLTNVPGASAVLNLGIVSYSNRAKEELLGVPRKMIAEQGAVSEPVACAMAEGVRKRAGTGFGVGITGIAGPGGGTPEKPVGTVYIAVAGPSRMRLVKNFNPFDRETFKNITAQQALDILRKEVLRPS